MLTKSQNNAIIYLSKGTGKGNFKMKNDYWINKEYGYIIPETELYKDAVEMEYDDITDPTSVEYLNFNLYYKKLKI